MTKTPGIRTGIDVGDAGRVPAGFAWDVLTSDPATSVMIWDVAGRILWINALAAETFFGLSDGGASVIGRSALQVGPEGWATERIELLQRVIATGNPVLVRSVWRGHQQFSWLHHIPARDRDEVLAEGDLADGSRERTDRFLIVTRGMCGTDQAEVLARKGVDPWSSRYISLGPLEVLTARELEVLALLGQGLSLKEIAATLHRAVKTVEKHRQAIGEKLKIHDRIKLGEIALRAGLTIADAERTRITPAPGGMIGPLG